MCYFHAVKYCKDNFKRYTRADKASLFADIYYLHCSSSEVDFNEHFEEVMLKWRTAVSEFATYFDNQWNNGDKSTQ
jgi:hypothetical protein